MGYLMYNSAFILWFDHFLDSGEEVCRWFFGKLKKKSKRHSEVNWPLKDMVLDVDPDFYNVVTCKFEVLRN